MLFSLHSLMKTNVLSFYIQLKTTNINLQVALDQKNHHSR